MTIPSLSKISEVSASLMEQFQIKFFVFLNVYVFTYLFGTHENFVTIALPIFLIVFLDTMMGVMYAIKSKNFSTTDLTAVGVKALVYSIYVLTARVIDSNVGSFSIPLIEIAVKDPATIAVKSYILGTEALSIFENAAKLGFKIPPGIKKYLKDFTDDGQEIKK